MPTANVAEDRKSFIGASDAAASIGMSRWKTPLEVWAEKTGRVQPEDISNRLPVKLGNRLEEVVAELFMEETGKRVHKVSEPFIHKRHPFLACHIDRKVEGERSILQCKTASAWKVKEWEGEEIPHEYIIQELHELACTDYDRAYIAVLIGNQEFKWKVIERDSAAIAKLTEREVYFWNEFIQKNVMPSNITRNDSDILFKIFPQARQGEKKALGDQANIIIEGLQGLKADLNNLEGIIDQQENELKAIMGDFEIGESNLYKVTWKNQTKKAHIVKGSTFRTLWYVKKED